jgi:hypothetical protein
LRRTIQEQGGRRFWIQGGARHVKPDGIDAFGHIWHAPGWPYIEPTQDATGDLIQTRNLLNSRRRALARRGVDIDDLDDEVIRDTETLINKAQDAADRLNARNAGRPNWVTVTWRDIAQPPMPEGVQISVASGAELGAAPAPPAAPGAGGPPATAPSPARKEPASV